MTNAQFRAYARECLIWAEQAKTADERESFLEIARALNQAAAQAASIAIATRSPGMGNVGRRFTDDSAG